MRKECKSDLKMKKCINEERRKRKKKERRNDDGRIIEENLDCFSKYLFGDPCLKQNVNTNTFEP